LIAYNFPAMSLTIPPTALAGLNIWGVKDSSGIIESAQAYIDNKVKILIGSDTLLAEAVKRGANGGICGIANFFPARMKRVYDLAKSGDIAGANELLVLIKEFSNAVVTDGFTPGQAISAFKSAAQQLIKTPVGDMRTPVPTLNPRVKDLSHFLASVEN
jgi:4-hydroxy-tetrahydrodipicolinate synthase